MRRVTRSLVPLVAALAGAAAVAGAAYGLLRATLPRTPPGEKLALKVMSRLEAWRSYGAVVRLGGHTLTATCTSTGTRTVITYDNGARVLVHGRHVHPLAPLSPGNARLLADRSLQPNVRPDLLVAEAVLGGSRSLYVAGLAVALAQGHDPYRGRTRLAGKAVLSFVLEVHPRVELLVSTRTLEPLAVRYASARVRGSSRLSPGRGARRLVSAGLAGC